MFRVLIACMAVLLATPSMAATSYKLAGRVMSCQGAQVKVDNSLPSEGAGTFNTGGNPKNGTIFLNTRMMSKLKPAVQWFIFSHECGHLFGNQVTETRADRYGVWKGVDEGWLKESDLQAICVSFDLDAPASRTDVSYYPSGKQRCANVKGWFADFDAKQKAYEAKLKELEAMQNKAEELTGTTEVAPETK